MSRLDLLRQLADAQDADAILVTHPVDFRWAIGFTGSNGLLVVTPQEALFVTDGRYTEQARHEVTEVPTEIASGGLAEHVSSWRGCRGVQRAVVASEHLTVAEHLKIKEALGEADVVPIYELLAPSVAAKSETEIKGVRRAQAVTDDVFEAILPSIRAGVTERDLAAQIVYEHLKRGAAAMSFEPIVASGPRGALPHARPSDRQLELGDMVVIDMGGVVDGLCSDMTRTVAIGDPGTEAREAYDVVLNAQQAALDAAEAGITGSHLDRVAREVIELAGLGAAFSHSLGHGVGYDVHEWPRLSQQVDHVLPAGATVTIEPGVYLPDRFGIRIEDVIVLREGGSENLTPTAKELLIL